MTDPTKAERARELRRKLLLVAWVLGGALIVGRAAQLQVMEGSTWRAEAERQQRTSMEVPAARGRILDRDGVPLAVSNDVFQISVAPGEVPEASADAVIAALSEALDLSGRKVASVVRSSRRWVVLPGRYSAVEREALSGLDGVYVRRELRRFYPRQHLARGLLGVVVDGRGAGGVEEEFDELLAGSAGREILVRDSRGVPIPGESWMVQEPRPGSDVQLTIDLDLQEIAYEALREAVEETEARGGDILVSDPFTGELLALVSIKNGSTAALSAINTPYEPGSILKPFTVAGLLARGLADLDDEVDAEEGRWRIMGRTLTDVHEEGVISLGDALRVSSNIGVAKAAQAYTPAQQYENLRDFGFGAMTGIPLPGEATGVLRKPEQWSGQSPVSLAIGYEMSATPLQMAMAYGALANGGKLMEPRLVREVRSGDGTVVERRDPAMVRRVLARDVTEAVNRVLVDVVEGGTGTRARLSTFRVAGKSGTTRAYGEDGYQRGDYFSSFVGFFPADDPQLVVMVKLDRPQGDSYYGGAIAGPVTRATLEAVLSARRPPLDRRALATRARPVEAPGATRPAVGFASLELPETPGPLPSAPGSSQPAADAGGVSVPDVTGLAARTAVRRLHALGLHVEMEAPGQVVAVHPTPGFRLAVGDTVRLLTGGGADD